MHQMEIEQEIMFGLPNRAKERPNACGYRILRAEIFPHPLASLRQTALAEFIGKQTEIWAQYFLSLNKCLKN